MPIYTKKGDRGKTSLYGKDQKKVSVLKSSAIIEAIGAVDEANSYLGVVKAISTLKKVNKYITNTQKDLFVIASILAGAEIGFPKNRVRELETNIDDFEEKLPKITNFIYPGGGKLGAGLMYTRTLIRKAERRVVFLSNRKVINPQILVYLNRLSDFIYILSRYANYKQKTKEETWIL